MTKIAEKLTDLVGNTPLLRLNQFEKEEGAKANLIAKLESFNPQGSVKDRIALAMVEEAEKSGQLKPGSIIIEPTSGNTGIGLAFVATIKKYRLILTMPETMSLERRNLLKALGAELVLTPGGEGMKGAINRAEELAAAEPERYFLPQQFKNPANPRIHELTTGPEIWNDTDGSIDLLVAGVGTGGTISGISRYIKQARGKQIISVAVEPKESPVITQRLSGSPLQPAPHKIQGIGAGFIPDTLDLSLIDRVEQVSSDEAIEFARRLAKEEGLLAGISSGAAAAVAVRLAQLDAFSGRTIVVILPDGAERYLSTPLFEGV